MYAEPYYIHSAITETSPLFTWKINNVAAPSDDDARNAITLSKVGVSGDAIIQLEVLTNTRIPQRIKRSFEVSF
jgi:hypothetical protein